MKVYAISDLHLNYRVNRDALVDLPNHSGDWLLIAGDIGESEAHFHFAFTVLKQKFSKLIWVPGNHDLWSNPNDPLKLRGEGKYQKLVSICKEYGVLTPEDPYVTWSGDGCSCLLAPLFLLYDYSFRPADVPLEKAVEWAKKKGILCRDEQYIHPSPYRSIVEWCEARYEYTQRRLASIPRGLPLVFISHFLLHPRPLERLVKIPEFSLWCGTRRTEDWHTKYPVKTVVYGHLHIRSTDFYDGVRFEEVSLGYPKHWSQENDLDHYLREILPGPRIKMPEIS